MIRRMVAVNEKGRRIGEDHPMAKLTNRDVDLLLDLRDEGFSYNWLAAKFEISKSSVRWYCIGYRRAQSPAGFRAVLIVNPRGEPEGWFGRVVLIVDPRGEL